MTQSCTFELFAREWWTKVDHAYDRESRQRSDLRQVVIKAEIRNVTELLTVEGNVPFEIWRVPIELAVMANASLTLSADKRWPRGRVELHRDPDMQADEAEEEVRGTCPYSLIGEVEVPQTVLDDLIAVVRANTIWKLSVQVSGEGLRADAEKTAIANDPRDGVETKVLVWEEEQTRGQSSFQLEVVAFGYQSHGSGPSGLPIISEEV